MKKQTVKKKKRTTRSPRNSKSALIPAYCTAIISTCIPAALSLYVYSQTTFLPGIIWVLLLSIGWMIMLLTTIRKWPTQQTSWRKIGQTAMAAPGLLLFMFIPVLVQNPQGIIWVASSVAILALVLLASYWSTIKLWWDTRK